MPSSTYIDDIFLKFFNIMYSDPTANIHNADLNPINSFYNVLSAGNPVTLAQSQYIIRLLTKYLPLAIQSNFDYSEALRDPKWKQPFRVIDQTKKIHVEKDKDGRPWICLKFPYQLKKEFDEEFADNSIFVTSQWDEERKLRLLSLYDYNLVQIYDFAKKHNFIIDDSFISALGEVEEIWSQEENIIPCCFIHEEKVVIGNVSDETEQWWNEHATGVLENDLLLAKSMCLKFYGPSNTIAEKIAADEGSHYWIKDNFKFLHLCEKIQGRAVIILDRAYDPREWVKTLVADAERINLPKSEIKICFRLSKDQDNGFNEWVKSNGLGGTVDQGKILIFDHKPAKWLFKQQEDVKLLVTNNLYPHTHTLTRDWINSHHCVIYLGDIKPTLIRDRDIVEL